MSDEIKDLTSFAVSTAYLGVTMNMLEKQVEIINRFGKKRKRKHR